MQGRTPLNDTGAYYMRHNTLHRGVHALRTGRCTRSPPSHGRTLWRPTSLEPMTLRAQHMRVFRFQNTGLFFGKTWLFGAGLICRVRVMV